MSAELRAVIERELAYVAGNDVVAGRLVEARDRILAASSDTAPLDEERMREALDPRAMERAELRESGLTCGLRSVFGDTRDEWGCGEPIVTVAEVYRCTECRTPFHVACAMAAAMAARQFVAGESLEAYAEGVVAAYGVPSLGWPGVAVIEALPNPWPSRADRDYHDGFERARDDLRAALAHPAPLGVPTGHTSEDETDFDVGGPLFPDYERPAAPLGVPSDTAWLIERGQSMKQVPTVWWTGERVPNVEQWTTDANKAKRFASRAECEAQIEALSGFVRKGQDRFGIATEHSWIAPLGVPSETEIERECGNCGGEGWISGMTADPLIQETCPSCDGRGRWYEPSPGVPVGVESEEGTLDRTSRDLRAALSWALGMLRSHAPYSITGSHEFHAASELVHASQPVTPEGET